jgi:hypothetical protein
MIETISKEVTQQLNLLQSCLWSLVLVEGQKLNFFGFGPYKGLTFDHVTNQSL